MDDYSQDIIKDVQEKDGAVIISLAGEIDMKSSSELRTKFMKLFESRPAVLIVDMTKVEFMDSSGLAILVETLKWCRQNDSRLKLVGMVQTVRNVFEISRLDSIFQICDTLEEALG
jgi:anti-sigma B factor antagonist